MLLKGFHFSPERGLALLLALSMGAVCGVGVYTFVYAKGFSYLTDDPAACANCHVMRGQFDAWIKGSHHGAAACNDCHTPHQFAGKYAVKGLNGLNHSLAFTTGRFSEPIRITALNRRVTEAACRYCHGDIVQVIDAASRGGEALSCIRCHSEVGHAD